MPLYKGSQKISSVNIGGGKFHFQGFRTGILKWINQSFFVF